MMGLHASRAASGRMSHACFSGCLLNSMMWSAAEGSGKRRAHQGLQLQELALPEEVLRVLPGQKALLRHVQACASALLPCSHKSCFVSRDWYPGQDPHACATPNSSALSVLKQHAKVISKDLSAEHVVGSADCMAVDADA